MYLSARAKRLLRLVTGLVLAAVYVPLLIIVVLSFNSASSFSFPPEGLTVSWWSAALRNAGARSALVGSIRTAAGATLIALVLGTMASFAIARFRFFGREAISLLIILPIALPGIVTGIALNASLRETLGLELGYLSLTIAHATFCIVVVFNNVVARLRRISPSLEEASADLGANGLQTFRHITFPLIRSALAGGAVLAFALSFDEIVVTNFTAGGANKTLPQWIFSNTFRPNQLPQVNVVAVVVILLSIIPVWITQRLARDN